MANQYTKLTRDNILRKVNRQRNPVTSIAQLAREFGQNTHVGGNYSSSTAAPGAFREKVRALVGAETYNRIRNSSSINRAYR